jgi:hypothetical protein
LLQLLRSPSGTFRLIASSASTAALEGEADMAGNGPKTTFMTDTVEKGLAIFGEQ